MSAGVLGLEVPSTTGGKVCTRAGSQDGVDIIAFKVTKEVLEVLDAELVDVAKVDFFASGLVRHGPLVLDVKTVDLISGFNPWLTPSTSQVKQRQDHLVGVGIHLPFRQRLLALLFGVLTPLSNLGLSLLRREEIFLFT